MPAMEGGGHWSPGGDWDFRPLRRAAKVPNLEERPKGKGG